MNIEVVLKSGPLCLPSVVIPGCGAVVRFDGIVRAMEDDKTIAGLDYEAYQPMAEKVMETILRNLHTKYPFHLARVHHRIGWVPVGEAAISMDIHSPHRKEAFAALSEFMELLKQYVPIWKGSTSSHVANENHSGCYAHTSLGAVEK